MQYLLSRGYAERSALSLVGNRYRLQERQRKALQRVVCSEPQFVRRKAKELPATSLRGKEVIIDGLNQLISLECALSGGYLFAGLDGCLRDIAGLHGTYKRVLETDVAIRLIGETLQQLEVTQVHWLLDQPVSNSGRLKTRLGEIALESGWPWEVELLYNPDNRLREEQVAVVISSDGPVLDDCHCWFNLLPFLLKSREIAATVINLSPA